MIFSTYMNTQGRKNWRLFLDVGWGMGVSHSNSGIVCLEISPESRTGSYFFHEDKYEGKEEVNTLF